MLTLFGFRYENFSISIDQMLTLFGFRFEYLQNAIFIFFVS